MADGGFDWGRTIELAIAAGAGSLGTLGTNWRRRGESAGAAAKLRTEAERLRLELITQMQTTINSLDSKINSMRDIVEHEINERQLMQDRWNAERAILQARLDDCERRH